MTSVESLLRSESNLRGYLSSYIAPREAVKIPSMNQHNSLISFLAVVQYYGFNFLAITWRQGLDKLGVGATAEVRQALLNLDTAFAFKQVKQDLEDAAKKDEWHHENSRNASGEKSTMLWYQMSPF